MMLSVRKIRIAVLADALTAMALHCGSPKVRDKLKAVKDSMLEMRAATAERQTEMRIEAANELADRRALLIKQAEELQLKRVAQ